MAQRKRICLQIQETWVWSQDQEDPLEKEKATHSSILAWEIPWTEEPGGLQSMGSQSQTGLSVHTHTYTHALTSRVSAVILLWPLLSKLSPFWTSFRWTIKCQEEEGDTWVLWITRDFSPSGSLSAIFSSCQYHFSSLLINFLCMMGNIQRTYRNTNSFSLASCCFHHLKKKKKMNLMSPVVPSPKFSLPQLFTPGPIHCHEIQCPIVLTWLLKGLPCVERNKECWADYPKLPQS